MEDEVKLPPNMSDEERLEEVDALLMLYQVYDRFHPHLISLIRSKTPTVKEDPDGSKVELYLEYIQVYFIWNTMGKVERCDWAEYLIQHDYFGLPVNSVIYYYNNICEGEFTVGVGEDAGTDNELSMRGSIDEFFGGTIDSMSLLDKEGNVVYTISLSEGDFATITNANNETINLHFGSEEFEQFVMTPKPKMLEKIMSDKLDKQVKEGL